MSDKSHNRDILIHPVFNKPFISSEHPEGQLKCNGDALGRDCVIVKQVGGWMKMYKGDGSKNEDWYGWNADVLAPCDSTIEAISVNNITNVPGNNPGGKSSHIIFKRADGTRIVYAHVQDIVVNKDQKVKVGDVVAKVGNNGASCMPHIHIGSWMNNDPLQIRFDLKEMGIYLKQYFSNNTK